MRIPCPHCGERDASEFRYLGDGTMRRPDDGGAEPTPDWAAYVYLRDNPAGPHDEFWHHVAGCRAWLTVRRDTRTHAVLSARVAGGAG